MAWLDDRIWAHPKFVSLPDKTFRVAIAGICYANGFGTQGRLTRQQQKALGATPTIRAQLIAAELWDELGEGTIEIHDWYEHNGQREERREKQRTFDRRRKQLYRDPELRVAVRDRDGDHCRYCGKTVNWLDRKGPLGGTYDHIDPNGENSLENLVVCCRSCNSRKAGRSLNEARMTLLPVPLQINADLGQGNRSGTDQTYAESRPDLDLSSRERAHVAAGAGLMTGDGVTEGPRQEQQQTSTDSLSLDAARANGSTASGSAAAATRVEAPTQAEIDQALATLQATDKGSFARVAPLAEQLPAEIFHQVIQRVHERKASGSVKNDVGLLVDLLRTTISALQHAARSEQAARIAELTPADEIADTARSYALNRHPWDVVAPLLGMRIARLTTSAAERGALLEAAQEAYADALDPEPAVTTEPR